jgi:hypothetical protein
MPFSTRYQPPCQTRQDRQIIEDRGVGRLRSSPSRLRFILDWPVAGLEIPTNANLRSPTSGHRSALDGGWLLIVNREQIELAVETFDAPMETALNR